MHASTHEPSICTTTHNDGTNVTIHSHASHDVTYAYLWWSYDVAYAYVWWSSHDATNICSNEPFLHISTNESFLYISPCLLPTSTCLLPTSCAYNNKNVE